MTISKTTLFVALGFSAAVILIMWLDWRGRRGEPDTIRVTATERFQSFDSVKIPILVQAPVIPDEELDRLREDYSRPDLDSIDMTLEEAIKDPEGYASLTIPLFEFVLDADLLAGTPLLVVREGDGRISVVPPEEIEPEPEKFIEITGDWEFGVGYELTPQPGDASEGLHAWGRYEMIRVGDIHGLLEAGDRPGVGGYVLAAAVWRSR